MNYPKLLILILCCSTSYIVSCGGSGSNNNRAESTTVAGDESTPEHIAGKVTLSDSLSPDQLTVFNSTSQTRIGSNGEYRIDNPYRSNQLFVSTHEGKIVYRALIEDEGGDINAESTAFYYAFFGNFALRQLGPKMRHNARLALKDLAEFHDLSRAIQHDVESNGFLSFNNISSEYTSLVKKLSNLMNGTEGRLLELESLPLSIRSGETIRPTHSRIDYVHGISIEEEEITKNSKNDFTVLLKARSIYPLPLALWQGRTIKVNDEYKVEQEKFPPMYIIKAQNASNFLDVIKSPLDTTSKFFEFLRNTWKNYPEDGWKAINSGGDISDAVTYITLSNLAPQGNLWVKKRSFVSRTPCGQPVDFSSPSLARRPCG